MTVTSPSQHVVVEPHPRGGWCWRLTASGRASRCHSRQEAEAEAGRRSTAPRAEVVVRDAYHRVLHDR